MLKIIDANEFHFIRNMGDYAVDHPVFITRATYGAFKIDNAYPDQMRKAYAEPRILSAGHYAYLVAGQDAFLQGVFFGNVVKRFGGLRPQDFIACDDEEGTGDQTGRINAFLTGAHSVMHEQLEQDWGYSGEYFWKTHMGAAVGGLHRWIASYGHRPAMTLDLWQWTDREPFPGLAPGDAADGSIFDGTVDEFLALLKAPHPPYNPQSVPDQRRKNVKTAIWRNQFHSFQLRPIDTADLKKGGELAHRWLADGKWAYEGMRVNSPFGLDLSQESGIVIGPSIDKADTLNITVVIGQPDGRQVLWTQNDNPADGWGQEIF